MKGCIAIAAALATLVFAQGAFAQPGQIAVCPTYDGKSENGGWEGSAAPGITIVSARDDEVTIRVEQGYTLVRFCYKTGSGGGGETSLEAPITGPATFTIRKTNKGGGISHVTFDTERVATAVDECPNIEGIQSSVPAGMVKDASGNCSVTPITVTVTVTPGTAQQPTPVVAAAPALPGVVQVTPQAATAKVKTKKAAKKKAKRATKAKRKAKRGKRKVKALPRVLPFTP